MSVVLNVTGAAQRQLGFKTTTPATCLSTAARALGAIPSLMGHTTHTALQAWNEGTGNVPDELPPVDFPGFWSGADGQGDVCLYLGDGKWSAIDWNGSRYTPGVIGSETTAQRSAQVGGTYLGYQRVFLGYTLTSTSLASTGTTTPITNPNGGQEMALNMVHVPKGAPDGKSTLYCLFGPGFFQKFTASQTTANEFARQAGGNSVEVTASFLADLEAESAKGYSVAGSTAAGVSVADLETAFETALAKLPKPPTKITSTLS